MCWPQLSSWPYLCRHCGPLAAGCHIASLTGGFLFAIFPGVLFNVIGATAIFLAARMCLGTRLAARMDRDEGTLKRIKKGIDANPWPMLLLLRLVPVVPFFVANLVPALIGVPLLRFVISTFLGIIPSGIIYASVGAGLAEVFARGETLNPGIILDLHILLLPILGLALLAVLPALVRVLRRGCWTHDWLWIRWAETGAPSCKVKLMVIKKRRLGN